MRILKYPRTRHIEGSRFQLGDMTDDKPLSELKDAFLVVEEKVDGANCALSFGEAGGLLLQSRGHFLTGGHRERHFAMLKTWAACHAVRFHDVLGARFIMYGEWMYAKHTVFYDELPHYFLEFDVFDRERSVFLSTEARRTLLAGLPVMPVPVLHEGRVRTSGEIDAFVRPSLYKSEGWREQLEEAAIASNSRADFVAKQTEDSDLAEGLYLKQEEGDCVIDRFKFVRSDFVQAIQASDSHWHDRPILPNQLRSGIDIFASVLGVKGAYDETS